MQQHVLSKRTHDPVKSLRSFERQRAELLRKFPGQFVIFCGPKLEGIYETHEAALAAGFKLFSETGFFLRKIVPAAEPLELLVELR